MDNQEYTQYAIDRVHQYISNSIDHAEVIVAGTLHKFPIYRTTETGGYIRKYVRVDDIEHGKIEAARLVDIDGKSWIEAAERPHQTSDGYMIAFPIKVYARQEGPTYENSRPQD